MSNDPDPPAEEATGAESSDDAQTDTTESESDGVTIEEPTKDISASDDQSADPDSDTDSDTDEVSDSPETEHQSESEDAAPSESQDSDDGDDWDGEMADSDETDQPDDEELSRAEELDEWEKTLDERERGLRQIRAELDSREEELEEERDKLRDKRQELQSREAELDEWETTLEERTTELDEREAAIEAQEQTLAERAEELDEHEAVLENYVDNRVGEALDGRIDRIEKVVGDRIVALEEEVSSNIQTEVSSAFDDQEETTPLSIASSVALGIIGAALIAVGVIFAFAGDIGSVPALHSDALINAVASGILVLAGLAATLTAATGRL